MRKTPGSPLISKRQLFLSAISIGVLFGTATGCLAQQELDFDTVMAKEGGYSGIYKKIRGNINAELVQSIKKHGDLYIDSLPVNDKPKGIRRFYVYLKGILEPGTTNADVEFFEKYAPDLLIDFIPYKTEFPDVASKGSEIRASQNLQRTRENSKQIQNFHRAIGAQRP